MSAPDTNIDKQEKQHKPALLGVKGAMIFGIVIGTYSSIFLAAPFLILFNLRRDGKTPGGEDAQELDVDAESAA